MADNQGNNHKYIFHTFTLIVATVSSIRTLVNTHPIYRVPLYISGPMGEGWINELMTGHPNHICCMFGVHLPVFKALVPELQEAGHHGTMNVSLMEQLSIFLYICVTGLSTRHIALHFQRLRYVCLSTASDPIFSHFFKDTLGVIDGCKIDRIAPTRERTSYKTHEGKVAQNCLFSCSSDMYFTFSYTGWEGSTMDMCIYHATRSNSFHIPEGKYYLVDAGFPAFNELLTPYCGVWCHLCELGP
jgi:DDE superfamily endonuclease